jgi:long-chain fatty acid transport protein
MRKGLVLIGVIGLLFSAVVHLHAGGFGITEKGVKGQGTSFAGGAASAEDASTIYWNPAGMTRLRDTDIELGVFLVRPSFEFNKESATNALGGPIPGGDGGDAGFSNIVPNLFVSRKITENFYGGIGVVVPFGLGTEYDDNWVGRYHTIKSDILTLDINPSVAYRINRQWSIGGGVSAQYIDAELTNAIDWGTLNLLLGLGIPTATGISPSNPNFDGFSELTGSDWSFGFNLGVLFELSEKTRFGLSYRSKISHDIDGDVKFTDPAALASLGINPSRALGGNQDAEASIDLPGSASLSVFHMLSDKWAVIGDITWTDWSQLEELRIKLDSGAPDNVTTLEWDDTWRFALGLHWYSNDAWTWRTGMAYDPTPVPNAKLRTPRVPDEDRLWYSLGGSWKISNRWSLDFAGTYIWTLDDPELNKLVDLTDPTNENNSRGNLKGTYDANSYILGAQINYAF